jgi:gluconolactonase
MTVLPDKLANLSMVRIGLSASSFILLPSSFAMKTLRPYLVLALVAIGSLVIAADEVLEQGSMVVKVAGDCKFTEGPVIDPEGNLLFSDGANDRIMRLSTDGKLSVFRQPCGRTNGMKFDAQGRLLMCQSTGAGGKRRVARLEKDGTETVMADRYAGQPFNAPNDLTVDRQGRIYFTDPAVAPQGEKPSLPSGVYRIDAPGQVSLVVSNIIRPNGILLTPDNKLLYLSDRGTQKLHRYEVQSDGSLKPAGIVYDFSPDRGVDGMCLDVEGNIYAAAGQNETTGLWVVSPSGNLLLHKPMPEFSTNVAFGGADMRDLYLTASTSVYRLRTVRAGLKLGK